MFKRCSYCGAQYSADEAFCPVDQQMLIDPSVPNCRDDNNVKPPKKIKTRALILIIAGALQFVTPVPSVGISPDIARWLIAQQIGVGIMLIAFGIYFQIRKPKRKQ
jgi:hypothetical protein